MTATATNISNSKITSNISRQAAGVSPQTLTAIYEKLKATYPTFAEVDDPWMNNGLSDTPFRMLVSVCLSTMTITKRVVNAAVPLYKKVSTFEELVALEDDELRAIIKPVAHYNRKTTGLKIMARQILDDHGGKIPETREELMKLHGVGRKVTDIMMNFLFSQPSIAVDSHVLRVLNRLGVVETTSPVVAADVINKATPKRFVQHAHEWLIQHGMKICVARRPKCEECPLSNNCEYYRKVRVA